MSGALDPVDRFIFEINRTREMPGATHIMDIALYSGGEKLADRQFLTEMPGLGESAVDYLIRRSAASLKAYMKAAREK